jgi:hypothetical protein
LSFGLSSAELTVLEPVVGTKRTF